MSENPGKEPHPYEPPWTCWIGPVVEQGRGLLRPGLWQSANAGLVDLFVIHFDSFNMFVDLSRSQIRLNSKVVCQFNVPPEIRPRLIWFRRMVKEYAEFDHNTAAFGCAFYGVGMQVTHLGQNIKHGYRITSSMEIIDGL